ncbi:MAG: primosomal protein N' [Acidobacteria bacterium]|jgi:primosomal protein N' (replication factor Y)|nr:primosomal protein N' [Acidobacteriota bacterium]MDP7479214.1 primosomal protein N' [Vicinamibacterales bacterium]HJN44840.1 primosomal protein N' [Vicinamibacterales bacterium]
MSRVVSVAVPVPALDLLSYEVPEVLPLPVVGARVLVPVGSRVMTGCVVNRRDEPAVTPLKPLIDVLDAEAMLPPEVVDLALWVGEYYACGPGEAIAAAMPPRAWVMSERQARITDAGLAARGGESGAARRTALEWLADGTARPVAQLRRLLAARRGQAGRGAGGAHALLAAMARDGLVTLAQPLKGTARAFKSIRMARLTPHGVELLESGTALGARQRETLELLRGTPSGMAVPELTRRGISGDTVRRLAERGGLSVGREEIERDPWPTQTLDTIATNGATNRVLTTDQQTAVDALREATRSETFTVALLHGVTGSGKTEVYRRLAKMALESKRQALILVPEIALTPAVATHFRQTFGARVAVQHSGLSDGARHDQWHRIRRGEVDVVVGTRSAVFAPLASLGLVAVDEEHDGSYKQGESPRYHGRDVAIMRAKRCGALVVLGSATPSLETYRHAAGGRYRRVSLPQRVRSRPLPAVRIVDMREEYAAHGPDVVFSRPLVDALDTRFTRREQALILLNRRGFASAVFCRQCARSLECPNCSVSLTFHRSADRARCHYCGYSRGQPAACPECGGTFLEQIGFGTERVESEIRERWPDARVARLDRDTTRRKGAAAKLLDRFGRGEVDVLVGTQMVAKGHDFPRVTLVGVVSADVGLGVADFRAAERTFQLLTQVAGRAGRGEVPGEAVVQTLYPDHYSIRYACNQAYEPFYDEEMRYRRAMRYPPDVSLVSAVVRGTSFRQTMQEATDLVTDLRRRPNRFRVLGPAAAPIGRLRGQYRVQLFLKGPHRREMREALLAALEGRAELKRRVVIDVDPLAML